MLLAVGALTVGAFVLRFSQIHQSLFGDEVWTYQDIYGRSLRAVLTNVHSGGENSPPLFFLLAYATAKLGDPTVWIRLPSIVLGAATIPVVYLIGRETVGRAAGLIASAVIALSPFSFFYGVEARPYATMAFFVAVSTLALLRAVATGRRAWWVVYVIASAAAAYSHYTSIFVLAAQGVWSLWACRGHVRAPLISGAVAALLYVPWLPQLRGKALAVIGGLHPLTVHNVLTDVMRPIAADPNAPLSAIPTGPGLGLIVACALVGGIFLTRSALRAPGASRAHAQPRHLPLLIALAAVTPIGLLLYSLAATDLWLPRGLYASVPAAALVLGALLQGFPRTLRWGAVAVVMGVLLFGTVRDASPSWRRPPFRTMAGDLDRNAPSNDPISVISFIGQPALISQFHRYHRDVDLSALWRLTPRGGNAYVIEDDNFARASGVSAVPAAPAGFGLAGRRKYFSAVMPAEIVTYRRTGGSR
jgi:Dolichyl-phosphate-mannose-protein mannosyltransferase